MYLWRVAVPSLEGEMSVDLDISAFEKQSRNTEDTYRRAQGALLWIALLGDSLVDTKPRKVIASFVASLHVDLDLTIKMYGDLAQKFISSIEIDHEQEVIFTSDLFQEFKGTPLFREYLTFRRTLSPELFRYIYTFLVFLKKLSVSRPDLEPIALRDWDEVEARISNISFETPLVETLRNIMRVVTADYPRCELIPRHGSGAVAEKGIKGVYEKSASMVLTKGLAYYLQDNLAMYPEGWSIYPFGATPEIVKDIPTSRLAFVPKSYKAVRSICMEPAAQQWAQQGVLRWIGSCLANSWLKDKVVLNDQSHNRELARLGSETNRYDTVDLSSASDSVSKRLVKAVFPARILYPLWSTRSSMVLKPDGTTVECEKFAPMGSAVCFPVQCHIFSSVVIAAGLYSVLGISPTTALSERVIRDVLPRTFGPQGEFGDFKVYGDDIICDHALIPFVSGALESLGFRYNDEKSFKGSQCFRESCGGHYFRGEDVTPLFWKFSEKLASGLTPEGYSSLIDAANRALDYGYFNLRSAIVAQVKFMKLNDFDLPRVSSINPVLFTEDKDKSWALRCSTPNNHHLQAYLDMFPRSADLINQQRSGLVRLVGRAIVDRNRSRLLTEMGDYRYVRWFASGRPHEDPIKGFWVSTSGGEIIWAYALSDFAEVTLSGSQEIACMRWSLDWEPTS